MATTDATVRLADAPLRRVVAPAAAGAVLLLVVARLFGITEVAAAQTFTIIFTAIVVEALPFVLLGALVSALLEVYVSDDALGRLKRLPPALQLPAGALAGVAFPVCECGSVPVARRLLRRGIHPAAGIAFMLASPIFNPIVLVSTWVAYSPRDLGAQMVAGRAALGLVVAVIAGWALGGEATEELLRVDQSGSPATHDHTGPRSKVTSLLGHLNDDFFFMGKFLVIGAALSAAFQTLLPQSLVSGVARSAVIGTLALMAIAYVSSLCSEADAFVAVSFSQFGIGSQLAFLVFGPILDFKLTFLYGAAFRRRFIGSLALVTAPLVVAGAFIFEVLLR